MATVTKVVAVTDGTASAVDASGIGKTSLIIGTAGAAHSANAFLVGQTVGGSGTGGWWITTSNFGISD